MDAALGKGAGGDQLPLVQLRELGHAVLQAVGKHQTLHLIILPDPVVTSGGVEHPVADIHQIQQPPELFLRQFKIHNRHLLAVCFPVAFQYSRRKEKLPLKKMGSCAKFSL